MIYYTALSSDRIRRDNHFTSFKDPNIVTKDIISIINNLYGTNYKYLNFNDPFLANFKVQYISCDNPMGWGVYPLQWAYIDIINYITNIIHPVNNFLSKVERISFEPQSRYKVYCKEPNIIMPSSEIEYNVDHTDVSYEAIYDFLSLNYGIWSYMMMREENPRMLLFHKEYETREMSTYIMSVGFNPYKCCMFLSETNNMNYGNRDIPYRKYKSLQNIIFYKLGKHMPSIHPGIESNVSYTYGHNGISDPIKCLERVHNYDYANIAFNKYNDPSEIIDDDIVNIMANSKPGVLLKFIDKDNNTNWLNAFTHTPNVRIDYRYYKSENMLDQNLRKLKREGKV